MKRTHQTIPTTSDGVGVGNTSNSRARPSKRPKHIHACASCRKHKTRCEILKGGSTSSPVRCHRCKSLNSPCSYSDMDRGLFQDFLTSSDGERSSDSPTQSPSEFHLKGSEHLQYPRFDQLWDFIGAPKGVDWSAPLAMLGAHALVKVPMMKETMAGTETETEMLPGFADHSMENILTTAQIGDLLNIFDARYTPWLNFALLRTAKNTVLDLICCTVASRHLEPSLRATVAPRLQKLTESTIIKMIFNPSSAESLESIQSLLILSLWSPVYGSADSGIRDGRVLVASAVSMAMNLRINEASSKVTKRDPSRQSSYIPNSTDVENMNKARLWISLTNTESMLCAGTGRMPLSRRSLADVNLIPYPSRSPSTVTEGRDLRLKFTADLLHTTEQGRAVSLDSPSLTDGWYEETAAVLRDMDRYHRRILPLQVVADHELFYFHMFTIMLYSCRLLTLYHFMRDAIIAFDTSDSGETWFQSWFLEMRPRGLRVITIWGTEALSLSEAILVAFLQADKSLIDTTPDSIFHMVSFAAGFMVGVKHLVMINVDKEMPGSGDKLLSRSAELLSSLSFSHDHAARRCAQSVQAMIATWERRVMNRSNADVPPEHNHSYAPPTPITPYSAIPLYHTLLPPTQNAPLAPHDPTTNADANWLLNAEIFPDDAFWAHFLGAQDPYPQGH